MFSSPEFEKLLWHWEEPLYEMPLPLLADAIFVGISSIPFAVPVLKTVPWLLALYLLKWYFGGARNTSERLMHSKVIMITVRGILPYYHHYSS